MAACGESVHQQPNPKQQNMTQVKDVYRACFIGTTPFLIRTGTVNALLNNVACDMPRQILYELADPYNATINVYAKLCHQFGKRRVGELFYSNRSA